MRTLTELLADPANALTAEEEVNFDAIMASGRTDGRPHSEFDYDPRDGVELPPCRSKLLKWMSKSRFKVIRVIVAEIRCRMFRRLCTKTFFRLLQEQKQ